MHFLIFDASPTTVPTTLPLTPAEVRQGMYFAVCLAVLIPAAAFFPLLCAAALRGRRPVRMAGAAAAGVVGITAAFLLTPVARNMVPVMGLYYALALFGVVVYALIRRRWPPKPRTAATARRAGKAALGRAVAGNGANGSNGENGANGAKGNGAVDKPHFPDRGRRPGG